MCCFLLRHRTWNFISCLSRATVYFCLHLVCTLKTARSVYAQCSPALGAGSAVGFVGQEGFRPPLADHDQIINQTCVVAGSVAFVQLLQALTREIPAFAAKPRSRVFEFIAACNSALPAIRTAAFINGAATPAGLACAHKSHATSTVHPAGRQHMQGKGDAGVVFFGGGGGHGKLLIKVELKKEHMELIQK